MQVNAIISATNNNKKINTTITYLRQSQKAQAPTLAQALNALTANIYEGVKVNEINVDLTGKPIPTLEIGNWSSTSDTQGTITYTGNGNLYVQCTEPAYIVNGNLLIIKAATNFSGTIYATETDTYAAVTRNFSR